MRCAGAGASVQTGCDYASPPDNSLMNPQRYLFKKPPAPRPPGSRHGELPAAGPGTSWGGVRARVCVLTSLRLHHQACTRCSGLARPRTPALQCLDVFLGAGELPRRLVFSCVCAGMVPVAPVVGAVLVCACCTGGTRCGLMCVWYLR